MLKTSRTEVFCKKGALNHLVKFTEQSLLRGSFSIKVVSLQSATLLKRRLQHRCFPVNVVKYLRTPILIKNSGGLLCYLSSCWESQELFAEAVTRSVL